MARDFTKNTSNYMSLGTGNIGPLMNGAAAVSIAAWILSDTTTSSGANDHVIWGTNVNGSSAGFRIQLFGVEPPQVRISARSVSTDTLRQATSSGTIAAGRHHVGGVANFTGDTITVYLNGAASGGAQAAAFGNNTYTYGTATVADAVGSDNIPPSTTAEQFGGDLAEIALWGVDIGADGFAALAKGVSPLLVRPEALLQYLPLIGRYSPETDLVNGVNGTITGTIAAAAHPRVYMPAPPLLWRMPAPAVAAGGKPHFHYARQRAA